MLLSINKYKFFLYIFFFIFLSSIFNFKFFENYQDKFSLKTININGLSDIEKKKIKNELNKLKNTNIFRITETKVLEKLNKFNFLENIYVNKIIPSSIDIKVSKTLIVGKTLINGEEFYIGKNGKLIKLSQLIEKNDYSKVFGKFQIDEYLNLLDTLDSHQINVNEIMEYYFFKNKRWDLKFSNNITLMLPSKNIEKSIIIYKKLLNNDKLSNVKIIDLRAKNQIVLTKKNEKF